MENRRGIAVFRALKIAAATDFRADLFVLFPQLQATDRFFGEPVNKTLCHVILVIHCEPHDIVDEFLPFFTDMTENIKDGESLKMCQVTCPFGFQAKKFHQGTPHEDLPYICAQFSEGILEILF